MADDILKNIPLPADLPENWTSGQIIAPTGAEVGLDDQHGYNYLMKQVNNAQKALKALVAQQEEDRARIKFWVSPDPTSPAELFGGAWERIKGKFIIGASDTYPAGSTGGSATHVQTVNEIVPHEHLVGAYGNMDWALWNGAGEGKLFSYKNTLEFSATANSTGRKNIRGFVGTDTVGDGQPMDILNPYYSVYIWRRVA